MSKYFDDEPMAVQIAYETVAIHKELVRLRGEVEELIEYKQKYFDLLDESINHSGSMIGGMLKLAMVPGVLEACSKANDAETSNV